MRKFILCGISCVGMFSAHAVCEDIFGNEDAKNVMDANTLQWIKGEDSLEWDKPVLDIIAGEQNPQIVFEQVRQLADTEYNILAQYQTAYMLYKGIGVSRDTGAARRYLQKAVSHVDFAPALTLLGQILFHEKADENHSQILFLQAAEQGFAPAEHQLSLLWLNKMATEAPGNIAHLYRYLNQALYYATRAADKGYPPSQKQLQSFEQWVRDENKLAEELHKSIAEMDNQITKYRFNQRFHIKEAEFYKHSLTGESFQKQGYDKSSGRVFWNGIP